MKRPALSAASIMACDSAAMVLPAIDGDAGEPGFGRALDGFRADRRQIEAQILAALRRLHQHAAAGLGANAALLAQPRHARQQARRCPRCPRPPPHDRRSRPRPGRCRRDRARAAPPVPWRYRRWRPASGRGAGNASLGHQDIGGDIPDADHPEAVLFEDAADPGQQMIVAAAKRRHDAGRGRGSCPNPAGSPTAPAAPACR